MDYGHEYSQAQLNYLEKQIDNLYFKSESQLADKARKYLSEFEKEDKKQLEKLKNNKITEKQYKKWRRDKLLLSDQWKQMEEALYKDFLKKDKIAKQLINIHQKDIFATNINFGTFEIEKGLNVDTSFTLYSKETVARLLIDNPDLLPDPTESLKDKIKLGKIRQWNKQQLRAAALKGILMGESIPDLAERIAVEVGIKNRNIAIRVARTLTTGAQNAGRITAYSRAESMGLKVKKQWLSAIDSRTRASHIEMNGKTADIEGKFSNGLKFPGDPNGRPEEVYNCRCTLVADTLGEDEAKKEEFLNWQRGKESKYQQYY